MVQTPPDSPDLNPIEDMWQPLRNRMALEPAVSIEELPGVLERVWEGLAVEGQILMQGYRQRLERIKQQGYAVQPVAKGKGLHVQVQG